MHFFQISPKAWKYYYTTILLNITVTTLSYTIPIKQNR